MKQDDIIATGFFFASCLCLTAALMLCFASVGICILVLAVL